MKKSTEALPMLNSQATVEWLHPKMMQHIYSFTTRADIQYWVNKWECDAQLAGFHLHTDAYDHIASYAFKMWSMEKWKELKQHG